MAVLTCRIWSAMYACSDHGRLGLRANQFEESRKVERFSCEVTEDNLLAAKLFTQLQSQTCIISGTLLCRGAVSHHRVSVSATMGRSSTP